MKLNIALVIFTFMSVVVCQGPRWRNGRRFARSKMYSYNLMKRYMDCRICQEIPKLLHEHQNKNITINNVKRVCVAAFSVSECTELFDDIAKYLDKKKDFMQACEAVLAC